MSKKEVFILPLALAWLLFGVIAQQNSATELANLHTAAPAGSVSVGVAELKEQLEYGLRAKLPSQIAFIQHVVAMVKENQLPEKLVKSTFKWARHKKPHPFPYFERALRLRAAKLGIEV